MVGGEILVRPVRVQRPAERPGRVGQRRHRHERRRVAADVARVVAYELREHLRARGETRRALVGEEGLQPREDRVPLRVRLRVELHAPRAVDHEDERDGLGLAARVRGRACLTDEAVRSRGTAAAPARARMRPPLPDAPLLPPLLPSPNSESELLPQARRREATSPVEMRARAIMSAGPPPDTLLHVPRTRRSRDVHIVHPFT